MNADDARELRIRTLFKKVFGSTGRTGAWHELTPEVQAMAECTPLFAGEVAVIFSMIDQDGWCLLTSRRLIWTFEKQLHHVGYEEIENLRPNMSEWAKRRAVKLDWAEVYEFADRLEMTTCDGAEWKVPMEAGGGPLNGILKALTTVIHDCNRAKKVLAGQFT